MTVIITTLSLMTVKQECFMLSVIMVNALMVNVVMLSVIMLSVIMLNVSEPQFHQNFFIAPSFVTSENKLECLPPLLKRSYLFRLTRQKEFYKIDNSCHFFAKHFFYKIS
jgi:hypothetical protein